MQKIDYALLLLRLAFALSLTYHGYNKLSAGIAGTAGWFSSIGMKWPKTQAWTAALTEVFAGLAFGAGFFTSVCAMAVIALMVVAIITVHWKVGYFIFLPNGGWEYCASIGAVAGAIAITGPGRISVDHVIGLPCSSAMFLIPVGVLLALCHLAISYRPVRTS